MLNAAEGFCYYYLLWLVWLPFYETDYGLELQLLPQCLSLRGCIQISTAQVAETAEFWRLEAHDQGASKFGFW